MSMPRFKLIDLLVSTVIIFFVGALALGQAMFSGQLADRVKCASNLRQIGQAMLLYANDNRGNYPRTLWDAAEDPKPVWGTPYQGDASLGADTVADPFAADDKPGAKERPAPNDVTAAMFLLLRAGDITPEVFTCPSAEAQRWDMGGGTNTAQNWTNWAGDKVLATHLSYSLSNPYLSKKAIQNGARWTTSSDATFAVAGDMNPGSDQLLNITSQSSATAIRQGNSLNHEQDGQNVLFGDGHVEFDQNSFVGTMRDNIYTVEAADQREGDRSASAGIIGSPQSAADSVLLPTAKSIGAIGADGKLVTAIPFNPVTPAEADDLRRKIIGSYEALPIQQQRTPSPFARTKGHLLIDDKTISMVAGPMTVAFAYQIQGQAGARIQLTLTAPDTPAAKMRIQLTDDGVTIEKAPFFSGQWVRAVKNISNEEEATALRKRLKGSYAGTFNGQKASLVIDDSKFVMSSGPLTMSLGYELEGTRGNSIQMKLTAPDMGDVPPKSIEVSSIANGIHISKSNGMDGDWTSP